MSRELVYPITEWGWNINHEVQAEHLRQLEKQRAAARAENTPAKQAQGCRRAIILRGCLDGDDYTTILRRLELNGYQVTPRASLADLEAAIAGWHESVLARAVGEVEGFERAEKERQKKQRQRATVPLP